MSPATNLCRVAIEDVIDVLPRAGIGKRIEDVLVEYDDSTIMLAF